MDLWLAEELRVNPDFTRWLCDKVNVPADVVGPPHVRTSVMSENGETDVEAVFEDPTGNKFVLLIENKVRHSINVDQLQRYIRRGHEGMARKLWKGFAFLLFAPSEKLVRHKDIAAGYMQLSFEDAAKYLESKAVSLREIYRAKFIARAALGERELSNDADGYRKVFWNELYELIDAKFEKYFVFEPRK